MRRLSRIVLGTRKRLMLGAAIVVALAAGAATFAWLSTTGSGAAAASIGSLAAPSITSATPGAGTVALAWSTVTPPASGTVTYSVSRDGGNAGGDCPTAGAPTTATSCTDTGLGAGTYHYTVTAHWRSWTATSTTTNVTVASGALDHFKLQAASTTPTAGQADSLTITAQDSANSTVTAYTGDKSLTFGGASTIGAFTPTVTNKTGTAIAFGTAETITFSSGVASVSGSNNGVMKLYKAESPTLTVGDGTHTGNLGVTVGPASATSFTATATSPQTAGTAFNVSLTAKDTYGNTATGYTGAKTIDFTGPHNSPNSTAPTYPATVTFTTGTATAPVTLTDAETTTITATEHLTTITGTTSNITINPASATSFTATATSPQTAGTAFNVSLTAKDTYGNTATGYTGAKTIDFTGPHNSPNSTAPTYPATVTFTTGTATAPVTLTDAETTTITATQHATTITGTTSNITINPASATSFTATATSPQTAGTAFNVSLTAKDTYGNTATGYTGAKTIDFTGPHNSPNSTAPTYPATVTFTTGTATAPVTLTDAETTTITATQHATTITGTTSNITINPASATSFTATATSPQTAGTAFNVSLTAKDTYGNTATGYTGAKTIDFTGPHNSPNSTAPTYPATVTFTTGTATAPVTLTDAETTTITATQHATTITGTTSNITINPGSAASVTKTAGDNQSAQISTAFSTQLSVQVKDTWGNAVSSSVSVTFSAPASSASATFANGGNCTSNPQTYQCVATTNGSGAATSSTFTANGTAGSYTISATAGTGSASFSETNTALVTFVGVGGAQTWTADGTKTVSYPAGAQSGDFLLLIIAHSHEESSSCPTGWTTFTSTVVTSIAGSHAALRVCYRFDAGETSVSAAVSSSSSTGWSASVAAFRNVNATTPLDGVTPTTGAGTAGSSTFAAPGLTTGTANATAVSVVMQNDASSTIPTLNFAGAGGNAQGFSRRFSQGVATSTSNAAGLADKLIASAGAVTFPTWTSNFNPGTSIWLGISISLRHS